MDGQRFDEFARRIATRSSRRGLLASVGASVLALAGLSSARAKRGKIGLCHRTRSGSHPLTYIEIDQHAVAAHLAHGDVIAPDFGSDASHCGGCQTSSRAI